MGWIASTCHASNRVASWRPCGFALRRCPRANCRICSTASTLPWPTCARRLCGARVSCGRVHANMKISPNFPDCLGTMSRRQRRHRVQEDEYDELQLDGRRRFKRPVADAGRGRERPVSFRRLGRAPRCCAQHTRHRLRRHRTPGASERHRPDRERRVVRAAVDPWPRSQRASARRRTAPEFMLDDDVDHPLATLQRKGVSADMPGRLSTLVPHN